MTQLTFRPAVCADAHRITLRPSDHAEGSMWVPGYSVAWVLASSIGAATKAIAVEEDGEVVALAGYTVEGPEVWPWLMCSERVGAHRKTLLREARKMLAEIREKYPQHLVCNHVHRPNLEARAFITTLGFRVTHSPGNAEFDFFYLPPCASQP